MAQWGPFHSRTRGGLGITFRGWVLKGKRVHHREWWVEDDSHCWRFCLPEDIPDPAEEGFATFVHGSYRVPSAVSGETLLASPQCQHFVLLYPRWGIGHGRDQSATDPRSMVVFSDLGQVFCIHRHPPGGSASGNSPIGPWSEVF